MRIVLDTNMLIASLISRGKCYALVEHALEVHEIIASTFILSNLQNEMRREAPHLIFGVYIVTD